jgi:hypothetical protein
MSSASYDHAEIVDVLHIDPVALGSKPGVYRVSVSYPGDSGRLPSSASVTIRVT